MRRGHKARGLFKRGGPATGQSEVRAVDDDQVTRAARRLRELKVAGVELHEILGGQAGAAFIRDDCDGDPEVAYEAIALVYYPTSYERWVRREQCEADEA